VSTPVVSIVLPTRNGATTLPAVLAAISGQRVDFPFELIAVDSSSSDGTPDLLRRHGGQVITVAADGFDHGLTRNLGIEQARGELVVLLVQDALPASDSWLAAITAPLVEDDRVAGAFARQLPRPDASPLARHQLAQWVASSTTPRTIAVTDRAELDALDPAGQIERCAFDNVCSCIRRSVWAEHPFRRTPIAEDIEWARDVLCAGYRLAYAPSAAVIHSHDRSVRYEFVRTCVLHRRLYDLFQLRAIPSLPLLVRAIASSLQHHWRRQPFSGRAVALAFAWPLGQYLGALAGIRNWKWNRSRMV
jgi:rhamnosyltransferase